MLYFKKAKVTSKSKSPHCWGNAGAMLGQTIELAKFKVCSAAWGQPAAGSAHAQGPPAE